MDHQKLTPKFFFLSLGVLVTLIASVTAFLNLVFQTLNHKFPDALNSVYQYGYNTYSFEAVRSAMATLIIVFPVYLVLSYFWRKALKKDLGHIDGIIKKWMLYLILFLASVVIIVDLITLVRYFVSGEITSRFIWKVAIALFTALLVGKFYILELMGKMRRSFAVIFALVGVAVIVIALMCSFKVIGSPQDQRAWRLDDKRVQDLQSIQWQVISYWQQKEKLPASMSDLSNPISGFALPVDPEFEKGLAYEYKSTEKMSFELCATFSANMPKGWQENSYGYGGGIRPMIGIEKDASVSYPFPGGINESWDHQAGRTCFFRTIDPDIYPPYPKPTNN